MAERLCKYCKTPLARGTVQAHEKGCASRPPKRAAREKKVELFTCPVCGEAFVREAFAPHVRAEHKKEAVT